MITNNGKEIISKYLLGQVPAYATHLAIGCGAVPLDVGDPLPSNLAAKQVMDFEMLRIPVSSKGFVDNSQSFSIIEKELDSSQSLATLTTSINHNIIPGETIIISDVDEIFDGQYSVESVTTDTVSFQKIHGVNISPTPVSPNGSCLVSRTKVSLTAEIPTDNRYEITEIALWSAAANSLAGSSDSRIIFNFSNGWQIHDTSISNPPLISNLGNNTADIVDNGNKIFYALTNDPLFQEEQRKERKEGPRYLNKTLMTRGDISNITFDNIEDDWEVTGTHVHLNGIDLNISQNNVSDIFKLAFCVVDKEAVVSGSIDNVRILMEFYKAEVNTTSGFAKAQIYIPGTYFADNRYNVSSFFVSQDVDPKNINANPSLPYTRFYTSPDFSASEIKICRIFVSIIQGGVPTDNQYLALDGFRIENMTENPVYKMSGYSVVKNDGNPIIKFANANNYIDFRFSLGIS